MKSITGEQIIAFADSIAGIKSGIAIAYLKGAEAALASEPPDVKTARQLLSQALAELAPGPRS